jgi:hypothetical protein
MIIYLNCEHHHQSGEKKQNSFHFVVDLALRFTEMNNSVLGDRYRD